MHIHGITASEKYHAPVFNLGDTGPAGGTIIYKATTMQSWGQYVEAAPANWYTTLSLSSENLAFGSAGTNIPVRYLGAGQGVAATAAMLALPASPAASAAVAYRGGGFSNWVVPTVGDASQLPANISLVIAIGFDTGYRGYSSPDTDDYSQLAGHYNGAAFSNNASNYRDNPLPTRPVRYF